jgi:hypothetical protein
MNLVVITLDTVRADALGAYGQSQPATPRIDALALESTLFEQAVASAPSTLPSHTSLFTGQQPCSHGVRSNLGYRLPEAARTLAEELGESGWLTHAEVAAATLDAGHSLGATPLFFAVSQLGENRAGQEIRDRPAHELVPVGIEVSVVVEELTVGVLAEHWQQVEVVEAGRARDGLEPLLG